MFKVGARVRIKQEHLIGRHYARARGIMGTIVSMGSTTPWDTSTCDYADVQFDRSIPGLGDRFGVYLVDLALGKTVLDKYVFPSGRAKRFDQIGTMSLKAIVERLTADKDDWQRHKLVSLEKELARRNV